MSHSYVSNLMHCTFSTKDRYPAIDSELESRLWPYLGGIAKENRMKALAIGGTASCARPAVITGHDELREGGSVDQRRIVEMDS